VFRVLQIGLFKRHIAILLRLIRQRLVPVDNVLHGSVDGNVAAA